MKLAHKYLEEFISRLQCNFFIRRDEAKTLLDNIESGYFEFSLIVNENRFAGDQMTLWYPFCLNLEAAFA